MEFTVDRQHQYYINKTLYTISYQSVLKPVKGIAAFESGDSCAVLQRRWGEVTEEEKHKKTHYLERDPQWFCVKNYSTRKRDN